MGSSRDFAFYLAELTIALLWLDFVQQNEGNTGYLHALHYHLKYTMQEDSLRSWETLMAEQPEPAGELS